MDTPSTPPRVRGLDLKAERVRSGLTQAELGARLGVTRQRIANIEGQYRPPAGVVARILAVLPASDDA